MRFGGTTAAARALLFVAACGAQAAWAQKPAPVQDVSTFPHRSPGDEQKALHAPPGFEIQLVAAEPDIQKPLNLAFDDRGRLWVTDTVEYPYAAKPGVKPRDTVKILSDFGPDGRARSITTFADGLNIPIGLLPLPSAKGALVYSIPNIHRIEDADGDGRADSRKALYGVYETRDTHGMTNAFTWGFDGWVYACHGFANESRISGSDKKSIVMNSGHVYRMRPDGSHAEYFSHGQVNPFGLAFDPLGNLYSCDCHSRPIYQLLRGAWYPSFGRRDDGLGFGPEMLTHDHGSTGIAGISFYAADQFPAAYRGTIFIGNVVTNRINHDRLEFHGSSPRGIEQPDFLWSEDNWFRPVDIELGPDGALYVADFYNRIIGHYEVPLTHPGRDRTSGRIWRIVYRGEGAAKAPAFAPFDLTKATRDELIEKLDDPTLSVRISAANQLVARFAGLATAALRAAATGSSSTRQRVHALWALERTGALDQATLLAALDSHKRELVVHALGVLVDRSELSRPLKDHVMTMITSDDPFARRAGAAVLGAHPALDQIRPLLSLIQTTSADDPALIHVARMALRDQLATPESWAGLESIGLSERDRRDLARVAPGVHSAESARYLLGLLRRGQETQSDRVRYAHHVARYGAAPELAELAKVAPHGKGPADELAILKAVQEGAQERGSALDPASRARASELADQLLASKSPGEIALGVDVVRDFVFRDKARSLKGVVERAGVDDSSRMHALKAIMVIDPKANLAIVAEVLAGARFPLPVRERAAELLGDLSDPRANEALTAQLPVSPEPLQKAIAAALAQKRPGATALLDAISHGKASARLLQDRGVVTLIESSGLPRVADQIAALTKGLPPADQKISMLFARRRAEFLAAKPDLAQGARVFEKTCAVCHQIAGKGARIGPQLDGIGTRGLDRLIEDVLDPSRNVDQTFRITNLALDDGRTASGLVLREEGEVVVLADSAGKEVRIPKTAVEERTISPLSLMPANMAEQISEPDFAALMAYLLSRKER